MTAFLDKETLTLIQDTAKKSVVPDIRPLPNNPEKLLVVAGGEPKIIDAPFVPAPRNDEVTSVASFVAVCARWGMTSEAAVWIDIANWRTTFFYDEPFRRESVTLRLKPSAQLQLLRTFAEAKAIDQKTLVRMLRHDLQGCVDPAVLLAFREVDFQKITTARAAIQHEKQSLDADIVAQVLGNKKPEGFAADLPLFCTRELSDARFLVGLTIDLDCDNRKFVLQTLSGHLERAIEEAENAVAVTLENQFTAHGIKDVEVLRGSPNS